MKTDIGYDAILRSLADTSGTISLRIDLHIEYNRIISSAQHCLESDTSPDQHIISDSRNIFLHSERCRTGEHTAVGKRILVPTAAHTDAAAAGKLQIRPGIVRIRQSKGILFCFRIVF